MTIRTSNAPAADLIVTGKIFTAADDEPWVEGFAVKDGTIRHVGTATEVEAFAGPETRRLLVDSGVVMPGFIDGHIHLELGGNLSAWELSLLPSDDPDEVLAKVAAWAAVLRPEEWVIGGTLGSDTYAALSTHEMLRRLDEASGGRPILLRDDTMHSRLVNTAALVLIGSRITPPSDAMGKPVGALKELECAAAEEAAKASFDDPHSRLVVGMQEAFRKIASLGYTTVQDAATRAHHFAALREIDSRGELTARVVCSMPIRPFVSPGIVGEELFRIGASARSEDLLPNFVKFGIDGVPSTKTAAMLEPYRCHAHDPEFASEPQWSIEELVEGLLRCSELGLGAKLHATGDAAVRRVLDAVEIIRRKYGSKMIVQIAHPEFIAPEDLSRFAELGVHADASPFMWFPSPLTDGFLDAVSEKTAERMWPLRSLLEVGVLIAGGSDWPCGDPDFSPMMGIETMVSRRRPGERNGRAVTPSESIPVHEAVAAFTRNSAHALGLSQTAGVIGVGLSADFIVTDRDVFETPIHEIHSIEVRETWFRGERVFSADDASTFIPSNSGAARG